MIITVSEIPDDGLELNEELAAETLAVRAPVHSVLNVYRTGSEVLVSGVMDTVVELQCGRCLKNFDMDIKSRLEVVYHPAKEIGKEEHRELKGDELESGFYSDDTLDTVDVLREQLLLSVPMRPLCSEDCKGLCPVCGADLSEVQCNCEIREEDPRLSVLKNLLKGKE
jgi:uncharacterized protein